MYRMLWIFERLLRDTFFEYHISHLQKMKANQFIPYMVNTQEVLQVCFLSGTKKQI